MEKEIRVIMEALYFLIENKEVGMDKLDTKEIIQNKLASHLAFKESNEPCCDMEEVQGIITRAVKGIRSPNKEEVKIFDVWCDKQFAKRGNRE